MDYAWNNIWVEFQVHWQRIVAGRCSFQYQVLPIPTQPPKTTVVICRAMGEPPPGLPNLCHVATCSLDDIGKWMKMIQSWIMCHQMPSRWFQVVAFTTIHIVRLHWISMVWCGCFFCKWLRSSGNEASGMEQEIPDLGFELWSSVWFCFWNDFGKCFYVFFIVFHYFSVFLFGQCAYCLEMGLMAVGVYDWLLSGLRRWRQPVLLGTGGPHTIVFFSTLETGCPHPDCHHLCKTCQLFLVPTFSYDLKQFCTFWIILDMMFRKCASVWFWDVLKTVEHVLT